MTRTILALVTLAVLAHAEAKLKLVFLDGKTVVATVSAFDEATVTVGKGVTERKVPWAELTPLSAFEARKALTPFDDGEARLELSGFAALLRLYPQAFEQLEIALALGILDEAGFEKRSKELEAKEVKYLGDRVDRLLEMDHEPAECLSAIKRLKERYPTHELTGKYGAEIPRLVKALEEAAKEREAFARLKKEGAEAKALRKKIESYLKKKDKAIAEGDELKKEGFEAADKGVISRVKKRCLGPRGAEGKYKKARDYLRKIVRKDRTFSIVSKESLRKDEDQIIQRLIEIYLKVTQTYMRDRNYKRAWQYVHKVLLYDPIHEEALEIRDEIRKKRITRKVSEITNARPRVTGG